MSQTYNYPGVYIEEINSGVRTITGASTSVTAFIGRAKKGAVNKATTIHSFAEFENTFGGLWEKSNLGFAVRDYFMNGGSKAVVVRLFKENSSTDNGFATFDCSTTSGNLTIKAKSPGVWSMSFKIEIDHTIDPNVAKNYQIDSAKSFNLRILDNNDNLIETLSYLTVESDNPRNVGLYLELNSKILTVTKTIPNDRPEAASNITATVDSGNDGQTLSDSQFTDLSCLNDVEFNLLCIPPYKANTAGKDTDEVDKTTLTTALNYCKERQAFLIVDAPAGASTGNINNKLENLGLTNNKNAAVFYPRIQHKNPFANNQIQTFAACGAIAGVFAKMDANRGVWKAPAGLDANLRGIHALADDLNDDQIGELNPLGINCLRNIASVGPVVWGSRTLAGNDLLASEWKYISVRRLALYIEQSLYKGTLWAVHEPNGEELWRQLRANIANFMHDLYRKGAFRGEKTSDAYFVQCDGETTTESEIDKGIVNIIVGFAPLKPAEFVVVKLQQMVKQ